MPDPQTLLIFAQAVSVAALAAWLTTGAYENLTYPDLNRTFTSEVMDMARLRETYPDIYAPLAHRRIANQKLQHALFWVIVAAEVLTALILWVGAIALLRAALGYQDLAQAQALGLLAALMFTGIWASFLIVGNWFCYWFCHEIAQNTHFQMVLWGLATMILIAVGL